MKKQRQQIVAEQMSNFRKELKKIISYELLSEEAEQKILLNVEGRIERLLERIIRKNNIKDLTL